jgi:hypothetical protein
MKTARLLPLALVACLAACLLVAAVAGARVTPKLAKLDAGSFREFSQTNAENGTLTTSTAHVFSGKRSARAYYNGHGNGFARGIFNVNWARGSSVWYSAAYYLPKGFKSRVQGQVDLMRWDNYPSFEQRGDYSGISINRHNKRANLVYGIYGGDQRDISKEFTLPEGRWFKLSVHQVLGTAGAVNEVYLNGRRIDRTRTANITPRRRVERIRYGLVAISESRQRKPLTLFFDSARVSRSRYWAR